ncbi:restriction endonuclease subunit S [Listeria monocytogenes]|nr:restriction endonuclease subunit S [Listeria monocytogenes]HAA6135546.1 restriction endonuclease subunit S [Listeria monocytogenes]
MSHINKRVPKRRFEEFNNAEAWEQRKVSDYAINTYGGGTPKTNVPEYWSGEIPWIQSSDLLISNLFNVIPKKYITELAVKSSATKFIPANSIAIVSRVGVGKLVFMPFEYTTSQDFLSLSNLQVDSNFGVYSIYMMLQKELKNIQGTSIKGITKKDLLEKHINKPSSREEQKKIGGFFKQLDETIALHQRKLEKIKALKTAYLSEMFPAEGETKPKRRFAGFTDDWEKRKLSDLGKSFIGLSGKNKEDFGHGEAKFITYLNVFNNIISDLNGTECVEIDEKQINVNYGDVFFTISSETPGDVGLSSIWLGSEINVYLNSFCFGYRPTIEFDLYYLGFMLRSKLFRKKITLLAQGVSRYNISKNKVLDLEVPIPIIEEQMKLGEIFKSTEKLIALHQRKLQKLQNIKKAYLNEMFI